jgi:hypothetical protein
MKFSAPSIPEAAAAALFLLALVHVLCASRFERLSHRFPRHAGALHLLGEVEVVFGFWACVLVVALALLLGPAQALAYAESRSYDEPLFVFAVMVIAASRPVMAVVQGGVTGLARALPFPPALVRTWLGLAVVPLAGSLVTEPAAMTLAALLLAPLVFRQQVPERAKYFALGVLLVNVSIGGTLTAYAAPPVLMVARTWNWDTAFMLTHFGWKAALAVLLNASVATWVLRRHAAEEPTETELRPAVPLTLMLVHCGFLAGVVLLAHHPTAVIGLFLLFLGYAQAYERHQSPLLLREALLVAFFLAGLVLLGGMQHWWLQPLVEALSPTALFFGSIALTAATDNAALTYLGSLIEGLSAEARYSLVAGAVAGGGLTVIANAPNPAGLALLKKGFADGTIGAVELLLGALAPTAVAALAFLFL